MYTYIFTVKRQDVSQGTKPTSVTPEIRIAAPTLEDALRQLPAYTKALAFKERLEYLRGELRAERISYGALAELQSLIPYIAAGDVELLEAAGVKE